MKNYDSFIASFGLNLKPYQKILLNLFYGKKFGKRFTKFSEQYKLISLISRAILQDNSICGIYDANNKTTTQDLLKLMKANNVQETMDYHVKNNKITFTNGSVIEILKTKKNENIRGKRANIEYCIYDNEFMCDKKILDEVLNKFQNKN